MSATTPAATREKRHHVILRHAKRPHGMLLIGAVFFVMAWAIWTFVLGSPIAAR